MDDGRESLLTVVEVAEYLAVPVRTIYAWRSRDEGPVGIRVGRHIRYRRASVEDFLERHTEARESRVDS